MHETRIGFIFHLTATRLTETEHNMTYNAYLAINVT